MRLPGAAIHEGSSADMETIGRVLADACRALERGSVPYALIGGMASAALGRPRCSSDIDLLVVPELAVKALELLEQQGFRTEQTNPNWLFKAFREAVLVDLLFKSKGDIYLDDEMLERTRSLEVGGHPVRVISPEDLIVIKALAFDEETSRHWYDALGLVAEGGLDWSYLVYRARKGSRRVLSLLVYATSIDLRVPPQVIRELCSLCYAEPEVKPWADR
jgi:predicted nucleotidyltransferase